MIITIAKMLNTNQGKEEYLMIGTCSYVSQLRGTLRLHTLKT